MDITFRIFVADRSVNKSTSYLTLAVNHHILLT
jgi:hypothetical protein